MKSRYILALIVALFALFVGVTVYAQEEEITLETLAIGVGELYERVAMIEAKLAPVTTADGLCIQYAITQVQRETITKYFDAFGENLEPSHVRLVAVQHDTENELAIYHFDLWTKDRVVTETWRGCEFLDVGEWTQE